MVLFTRVEPCYCLSLWFLQHPSSTLCRSMVFRLLTNLKEQKPTGFEISWTQSTLTSLPFSAHSFRLGWCLTIPHPPTTPFRSTGQTDLRALGNFAHHLWVERQWSPWSTQKNTQADTLPFNFLLLLRIGGRYFPNLLYVVFKKCHSKTSQKIWPAAMRPPHFPLRGARCVVSSPPASKATATTASCIYLRRKWFALSIARFCRNPWKSTEKSTRIQLSSRSFCSFLRLEWREALPPAGWTSAKEFRLDYIWPWFYM